MTRPDSEPGTCPNWNLDFSDDLGTVVAFCIYDFGHDGPCWDATEGVGWVGDHRWRTLRAQA